MSALVMLTNNTVTQQIDDLARLQRIWCAPFHAYIRLMVSLIAVISPVYQGGDWGHIVSTIAPYTRLACMLTVCVLWQLGLHTVTHYGHKHVKAWHSNMPLPGARPSLVKNPLIFLSTFLAALSKGGRDGLQTAQKFGQQGTGYSKMQSTKPQTLAYALTDSPVGLLAWIYEKLVSWSDKYPWTDDEGEDNTLTFSPSYSFWSKY